MVKGEDKNFAKFKKTEAYKNLKIKNDNISQKITTLFNNNRWELKKNFKELKEHYQDIGKLDEVSWLNGIQFLDIVNEPKYNDVSLEAFKRGDYRGKFTLDKTENKVQTETVYANRIIFFTKNLPSFKQYEGQDDIKWIVKNNRLLFYEMIQYHNEKGNTRLSVNKDLKAIVRALLLLLGETNELRYKFSNLSTDLKLLDQFMEDDNRVKSKNEINTFVPYEQLLQIVDELQDDYFKEYYKLPNIIQLDGKRHPKDLFNKHQILLAVALYVLDYPSRSEKQKMYFIKDDKEADDKEGAFINISGRYCKIIINNDRKNHKPISYSLNSTPIKGLNERLNNLLKFSYIKYPRKSLFINKNDFPNLNAKAVDEATVAGWLRDLISSKNLGVNGFRSSFISYYWNKFNNRQKAITIVRMRTSKAEVERNYLKKYTSPDQLVKVKIEPTDELVKNTSQTVINVDEIQDKVLDALTEQPKAQKKLIPEPTVKKVVNVQDRKKENFKKYYSNPDNAEKHRERVKKYNNSLLTVANRYARELNSGMLDWNRLLKSTKDKYQLYTKDGKYYTKIKELPNF